MVIGRTIRIVALALAITMMVPMVGYADFQKGMDALKAQDFITAISEFRLAAEQGNGHAQLYLGIMYGKGLGVVKDGEIASKWLQLAIDANAITPFQLGVMFGTAKYHKEATKWYIYGAERGDVKAQTILGLSYANGERGLEKDHKEASKWLRLAAEQGYAESQFYLGSLYEVGAGVPKDSKEAIQWYRLAAKQGHANAQLYLGTIFVNEEGVPENKMKAKKWLRLAAEQGIAAAQARLGVLYARDDYREAIKWFQLAVDQGDAEGQSGLGLMYEHGMGIPQNLEEAKKLYRLSAAQGNVQAQQVLTKLNARILTANSSTSSSIASKPSVEGASILSSSSLDIPFRSSLTQPDDIAVIIGNANYEEGKDIPNVTTAYADAASIKNYVTEALGIREENIIFLKDASQSELTATFGSATNHKGQLFNYVKPGKSKVFIYYSGHGAPGGEDGSSYIVPTDAQASLIDLNGYPLSTLYKNLGKIPAKSVTVVLEACFSGASQSGSVITQASPIYLKAKETSIPSGITVIAAGAANQIASWEQDSSSGLFTKYFLKGMSGEADAAPYGNGDGNVGYDELGAYFKDTLTYYARRYYGRDQTVQIVNGGM